MSTPMHNRKTSMHAGADAQGRWSNGVANQQATETASDALHSTTCVSALLATHGSARNLKHTTLWSLKIVLLVLLTALMTGISAAQENPRAVALLASCLVSLAVAYLITCQPYNAYTDAVYVYALAPWLAYSACTRLQSFDQLESVQWVRDALLLATTALMLYRFWIMSYAPPMDERCTSALHRGFVDDKSAFEPAYPHDVRFAPTQQWQGTSLLLPVSAGQLPQTQRINDARTGRRVYTTQETSKMNDCYHQAFSWVCTWAVQTMFTASIVLCAFPSQNNNLFLMWWPLVALRMLLSAVVYVLTDSLAAPNDVAARHMGPTMHMVCIYPLYVHPWVLLVCLGHLGLLCMYFMYIQRHAISHARQALPMMDDPAWSVSNVPNMVGDADGLLSASIMAADATAAREESDFL